MGCRTANRPVLPAAQEKTSRRVVDAMRGLARWHATRCTAMITLWQLSQNHHVAKSSCHTFPDLGFWPSKPCDHTLKMCLRARSFKYYKQAIEYVLSLIATAQLITSATIWSTSAPISGEHPCPEAKQKFMIQSAFKRS